MSSSFLEFDGFAQDDPDLLTQDAIEYLRAAIPGWEPADGNLEVWALAAHARINAELMAVARSVPAAVFKSYGQQLIGLPPILGTSATITTTWAASDSLGHTAPAGTQVGYRVSGDTLLVFEPLADVVIPAGSTNLGGVTVTAVNVGVIFNGVPVGALELVDSLSWLSSVTATTVSAGGVDAETDTAYLARLAAELRLLAPRPILPADFSVLAQNVTGVYRATTLDGYDPGTNEVQRITITGSPTGGTFPLTYSGQTASGIAYNATANTIAAALIALSNIGPSDVVCTGGPLPGTPVDVQFTGALGSTNVAQMTTSSASLTGGSTPTVAVSTPTPGVAPSTGNSRMVTVVALDSAGAGVSSGVKAAVQTYLDGLREVGFTVHTSDPTSTTVNVAFSAHILSGYDSATVIDAAEAAVTAFLSPATWDGGTEAPPAWHGETTVRRNQLIALVAQVAGIAYVTALTLNGGTSDITLAGAAPLPAVGTVVGTAV